MRRAPIAQRGNPGVSPWAYGEEPPPRIVSASEGTYTERLTASLFALCSFGMMQVMDGTVNRHVVYRLLPQTRGNWRLLERVLEGQRQLYNAALQERSDAWRLAGVSITWQDQFKSLTVCRRDLPEMAAVPAAIQRGTLKRVDEAFKGFFRRVKAREETPGYPRFRGRRRFDSVSVVSGVKLEAGRLRLPGFGWMKVRRRGGNPYPDGVPVSAVLKREAGKWYAAVCHAVAVAEPEDNGNVIGVDMNARQVALWAEPAPAKAGGRLFHAPDTSRLEARAKRLSRRLSRQKRGSGRRERTRVRLAKTRRHIAGIRRDWRHRTSRTLADAAHTVVIEDLRVRNMTRSARGTVEEPGRHVRAKAGLNRVVLDTGWAALRSMLEYKAGRTVAVNPRNTSRTCHACGHVDAASRRSQAVFHCVACGHADNADANAAREIRRRGLTLLHGEATGLPVRRTVKTQERKAA